MRVRGGAIPARPVFCFPFPPSGLALAQGTTMLRAACHLETPEGGGWLGRKRSARCMPGGEETRGEAGQRSGGQRGRWAGGCAVGRGRGLGYLGGILGPESGGVIKSENPSCLSCRPQPVFSGRACPRSLAGFLLAIPRRTASTSGRSGKDLPGRECLRHAAPRCVLRLSAFFLLYLV